MRTTADKNADLLASVELNNKYVEVLEKLGMESHSYVSVGKKNVSITVSSRKQIKEIVDLFPTHPEKMMRLMHGDRNRTQSPFLIQVYNSGSIDADIFKIRYLDDQDTSINITAKLEWFNEVAKTEVFKDKVVAGTKKSRHEGYNFKMDVGHITRYYGSTDQEFSEFVSYGITTEEAHDLKKLILFVPGDKVVENPESNQYDDEG